MGNLGYGLKPLPVHFQLVETVTIQWLLRPDKVGRLEPWFFGGKSTALTLAQFYYLILKTKKIFREIFILRKKKGLFFAKNPYFMRIPGYATPPTHHYKNPSSPITSGTRQQYRLRPINITNCQIYLISKSSLLSMIY